MAGKWGSAPLDQLVDDIFDRRGVTPLKLGSDFVPTGYRVISAKAIKNRRVDLSADEPRFVDEATHRRWMRTPLLADDVILTSEAPLGEPAYVRELVEWCLGQRLFGIRTKKRRLHGRFLFYALQSEEVRHDLLSRGTGTTAQGVRQSELRRVQIPLPEVGEQRAIAHILGTLDDKIELNRRMNETLEAMARALFKSWFVDFDPVRAKAEGRDPGLPQPLADLFPDRFEDAELGETPKGWTYARLGEWVTTLSGGTPSSSDSSLWAGEIPWISPKVMTAIHADEAEAYVTERALGNGTRLAPAGATLVMVRGMGLHEKVRISHVSQAVAFNQDVKALVPRGIEPSLLLFALLEAQGPLLERVESSGHGTGRLPSEVLLAHPIAMPSRKIQAELAGYFDTINHRIASARAEARILARVRDALLPKLISGEVRVKDAGRVAASVT